MQKITTKGVYKKISRRRKGNEKKERKIAKSSKNSTIEPLPGGEGRQRKKDRKIAKNTENITFKPLYYICIMYENPGGARPPCPPLPTPMITTVTYLIVPNTLARCLNYLTMLNFPLNTIVSTVQEQQGINKAMKKAPKSTIL